MWEQNSARCYEEAQPQGRGVQLISRADSSWDVSRYQTRKGRDPGQLSLKGYVSLRPGQLWPRFPGRR